MRKRLYVIFKFNANVGFLIGNKILDMLNLRNSTMNIKISMQYIIVGFLQSILLISYCAISVNFFSNPFPHCALLAIFFQSNPSSSFFFFLTFRSCSCNHSPPFLTLLLLIIPHLNITIPSIIHLPICLFIPPPLFFFSINLLLLLLYIYIFHSVHILPIKKREYSSSFF
jgi:hypothetical protein